MTRTEPPICLCTRQPPSPSPPLRNSEILTIRAPGTPPGIHFLVAMITSISNDSRKAWCRGRTDRVGRLKVVCVKIIYTYIYMQAFPLPVKRFAGNYAIASPFPIHIYINMFFFLPECFSFSCLLKFILLGTIEKECFREADGWYRAWGQSLRLHHRYGCPCGCDAPGQIGRGDHPKRWFLRRYLPPLIQGRRETGHLGQVSQTPHSR